MTIENQIGDKKSLIKSTPKAFPMHCISQNASQNEHNVTKW